MCHHGIIEVMENWLEVVGYEGVYDISDLGNVRSIARNGTIGGILRLENTRSGYLRVMLSAGNKTKRFNVHVLVAGAFLGSKPRGMQVNHKNGVKSDNRLENLEYLSSSDNHKHAYERLRRQRNFGSTYPMHKLSDKDIVTIRSERDQGTSLNALAARFSVSISTISMIGGRKIWRHIP